MIRSIKEDVLTCPGCGGQVKIRLATGGGCLSSPDYVQVADWVYHTACWDKQMKAFPPMTNDDRIIEVMGVPYAREALGRIRAAGFEVVPREPTETMISAANRLNHPRDEEVWRTMIDAYRNTEITPQSSG